MGTGESSIKEKYPAYNCNIYDHINDIERRINIYKKEEINIYRDFLKKDLGDLYNRVEIEFVENRHLSMDRVEMKITTLDKNPIQYLYFYWPYTNIDKENQMIKKNLEEHFATHEYLKK